MCEGQQWGEPVRKNTRNYLQGSSVGREVQPEWHKNTRRRFEACRVMFPHIARYVIALMHCLTAPFIAVLLSIFNIIFLHNYSEGLNIEILMEGNVSSLRLISSVLTIY